MESPWLTSLGNRFSLVLSGLTDDHPCSLSGAGREPWIYVALPETSKCLESIGIALTQDMRTGDYLPRSVQLVL